MLVRTYRGGGPPVSSDFALTSLSEGLFLQGGGLPNNNKIQIAPQARNFLELITKFSNGFVLEGRRSLPKFSSASRHLI